MPNKHGYVQVWNDDAIRIGKLYRARMDLVAGGRSLLPMEAELIKNIDAEIEHRGDRIVQDMQAKGVLP